jgi:NAD(P)-dependent dehydrogenase (short-subunit alcohol dehydrogenase family)
MYELQSKIVLIVGGTTGIGFAAAKGFAAEGAHIIMAGRNPERGLLAQTELKGMGADAGFIECDVSDASAVNTLIDAALGRFGRIDCAVNSAGYDFTPGRAHEMQDHDVVGHGLVVDGGLTA